MALSSFPADVMHDGLEGVISFDLEVVIKGLVKTNIITVRIFNERLATFNYGKTDSKDKPAKLPLDFVQKNKSLSGKAAQKCSLFYLLPFLIGDLVPIGNKYWELYILCRQTFEIIFSPVIDTDWLPYLESTISDHNRLFLELGQGFPAKVHYLLHYPRLILENGPLRWLWCMRFEANHQYFKNAARQVRNFINISKTLAERYQMRKCYINTTELVLGGSGTKVVGKQRTLVVNTLPKMLQLELEKFSVVSESDVLSVRQVEVYGSRYTVNTVLVLDVVQEEEIPVFLLVKFILEQDGLWFICGTLLVAEKFLNHYHAFSINEIEDGWCAINLGQNASFQRLSIYTVENKKLVSLRHSVCKV